MHSSVTKLEVFCSNCTGITYEEIDLEKDYTVVATSYLINGGDGNKHLKNNHRNRIEGKQKLLIIFNIICFIEHYMNGHVNSLFIFIKIGFLKVLRTSRVFGY